MSEQEQRPRLGVAALIIEGDKLLLGKRGKEPNFGRLILPGGGVQRGERWRDALKREIREETGLEVEINEAFPLYPHEIIGENEHRVILYVAAKVVGGVLRGGSDLIDPRFYTKQEIPKDAVSPGVRAVLERFRWL